MDDLVLQMGEGMVGVDDLGRQDGGQVFIKVAAQVFLVRRPQLPGGELVDPVEPQLLLHVPEHPLPLFIQRPYRLVDGPELLRGGHAGLLVHRGAAQRLQVVETAHPDHEKLVQVAGKDADELQPFQQGNALVHSL